MSSVSGERPTTSSLAALVGDEGRCHFSRFGAQPSAPTPYGHFSRFDQVSVSRGLDQYPPVPPFPRFCFCVCVALVGFSEWLRRGVGVALDATSERSQTQSIRRNARVRLQLL